MSALIVLVAFGGTFGAAMLYAGFRLGVREKNAPDDGPTFEDMHECSGCPAFDAHLAWLCESSGLAGVIAAEETQAQR